MQKKKKDLWIKFSNFVILIMGEIKSQGFYPFELMIYWFFFFVVRIGVQLMGVDEGYLLCFKVVH